MKKRSVLIAGHPTSVSLEEEFWDALKRVAQARGLSVNALIEEIDRARTGNLSSAIRVHVLNDLLARLNSEATNPSSSPLPPGERVG
ncbi:ribbon-helix-helix domain-containing protein [Azospirillum doebereinerae]|uniref:Aryl-sulfate sulfotransferase n=1 Tax=Azospirillum doebereinerae TaxID=92933 RepID=A0A433J8X7_9PROT|nr:ribbon-helix-helix domain-containing protein [Azospirillum doebereinerae]MCG5243757.1 ribbon-helix-helix domain-containing protein [Azospirillum doebereinerae]RUQ70786.1 aryl-sulfate sulfotransferase [Azospirillum doebereinerae]